MMYINKTRYITCGYKVKPKPLHYFGAIIGDKLFLLRYYFVIVTRKSRN